MILEIQGSMRLHITKLDNTELTENELDEVFKALEEGILAYSISDNTLMSTNYIEPFYKCEIIDTEGLEYTYLNELE